MIYVAVLLLSTKELLLCTRTPIRGILTGWALWQRQLRLSGRPLHRLLLRRLLRLRRCLWLLGIAGRQFSRWRRRWWRWRPLLADRRLVEHVLRHVAYLMGQHVLLHVALEQEMALWVRASEAVAAAAYRQRAPVRAGSGVSRAHRQRKYRGYWPPKGRLSLPHPPRRLFVLDTPLSANTSFLKISLHWEVIYRMCTVAGWSSEAV